MVLPRFPGLELHPFINLPVLTRRSRILGLCACLVFALAACTAPAMIVSAGATGAVAASEERGLKAAITDSRISTEINYYWLEHDRELLASLSTAVYEGRVMLTGVAVSEAKRDDAVRLAWKPDGVTEVINEIHVDAKGAFGTFARDTWISAKLRSKFLFDGEIVGINYSIDTVRGTVYLLGVAQNREEMERVLNHARNLSYVLRVVNHAILKTDPRRSKKKSESGKKPEG
ncbi:MAG: BON domain-containing protein [Alphaproteobacteria bacterium]|nr:BON domain-containing protein [Alphaproteobacteria bacterium]